MMFVLGLTLVAANSFYVANSYSHCSVNYDFSGSLNGIDTMWCRHNCFLHDGKPHNGGRDFNQCQFYYDGKDVPCHNCQTGDSYCRVNHHFTGSLTDIDHEWCRDACFLPDGSERNGGDDFNQCQFSGSDTDVPCVDCTVGDMYIDEP
eukprot:Pgem_evm1s6456